MTTHIDIINYTIFSPLPLHVAMQISLHPPVAQTFSTCEWVGVWRARLSSRSADAATSLDDVGFCRAAWNDQYGQISFWTLVLNSYVIRFYRKLRICYY